jgi:hypothetical protein
MIAADTRPRQAPAIEVNEVADGYVVYDPGRDRVHYLNHTAVLVLELCTGATRVGDMPVLVQEVFGLAEAPVQEVDACLARLFEEGLLC